MKDVSVLPSLLSADFSRIAQEVESVENCGAGGLHCDVMDGRFVPNITFGPMIIQAVKRLTDMPLYVHLMIEHPEEHIEAFAKAGAFEISVHAEACVHLHRVIQGIHALGVKAGVALNPHTPLCSIENVIGDVDSVLIMTVNPGFGGQSFIESMLPKIARTRQMAIDAGVDIDILVDGGIDVTTASQVVRAGANLLVAGTAVFGQASRSKACEDIRLAALTALSKVI
jgi:ribulose-phosphate 3-epimerase